VSTSVWLRDAIAKPSSNDGGSMIGGAAYLTWHTFEADPMRLSARAGADILIRQGTEVHFVVNPISGEIVQILPVNRAGRGLVNAPGGVQTNRAGTVNIQVEVIAYARDPFTAKWSAAGRAAIGRIRAFAALHGVAVGTWPAGAPLGAGARYNRIAPASSGEYTHQNWLENWHWDAGAISVIEMNATTGGAAPKPAPAPAPSKPKPTSKPKAVPGPGYAFPLPSGYYFGPASGGPKSVSGIYARSFKGRPDDWWLREFANQLARRGWSVGRGKRYLGRYGNDGKYGSEYTELIEAFQRDQDLGDDGLLGPATWNAAFKNPVT